MKQSKYKWFPEAQKLVDYMNKHSVEVIQITEGNSGYSLFYYVEE